MKSLTESVKSAMVVEASDLVSEFPKDIETNVKWAVERIEGTAETIDNISGPKLAKVVHLRVSDPAVKDYKSIVSFVWGWIYSLTSMMTEYEEEAENYYNMVVDMMDYRDSIEDNFYSSDAYYDLQTVENGEDGMVMLGVVLDNWNTICKAATGKIWNKNIR